MLFRSLARQEKKRRRKEREELSRELARGPIDLPFCLLVLMLMGVGLVMLLSASFPSAYYDNDDPIKYFRQQGVFAIAGVAAMLFIGKINYQRFRGAAKPLLYLSIVLLVLVIIPGNPIALTRNHATRWLGIRNTSFQFQPSEVAKMAVVLYFSDTISKKKDKMNTTRYGVAPYLLILGALSLLMMLEPHLSGTVLILSDVPVLKLVCGINLTWLEEPVAVAGGNSLLLFSGVNKY